MADAYEVLIADAIVSELNDVARSWQAPTSQFTASAPWMPVYQDGDLATLQCRVVPLRLRTEKIARQPRKASYFHGITFKKQVDYSNRAALNVLTKLIQDVHDWLDSSHRLATLNAAILVQADRDDIYDLDSLHTERVWECLIETTTLVIR